MPARRSPAREWIDALPAGTCFFAHEVPGRPGAVKTLLSRYHNDPDYPVIRLTRGYYAKQRTGDGSPKTSSYILAGALKLAGSGAALAGLSAVRRAGWTWQSPANHTIAVVGRPPQSPWPRVRYRQRSNRLRLRLTRPELTLIEAVRYYDHGVAVPWGEALRRVRKGSTHSNLKPGCILRPAALAEVALAETGQPPLFRERIGDICEALHAHEQNCP